MASATLAPVVNESPDSTEAPQRTYWLAECDGQVEREMLREWLTERGTSPDDALFYQQPEDQATSPALVEALAAKAGMSDDTLLAPIRVAWLPRSKDGERALRLRDLVRINDPRQPSENRKRRRRQNPGRWRIIEAEPARLGELKDRWQSQSGGDPATDARPFARFVARQAALALERAEYRVQGARYKIPRVTQEDVANLPSFRAGVKKLAAELGREEAAIRAEADEYLDELRTGHDPYMLDLAAKAFHWMYARSYGEADVVPEEIERLRALFAKYPVVLLPTHKTNHDSPVLESVLAIHNLPPPTLFAGINMSFWPMGSLMRRAGRVFLRRKIADNVVYKFVLREYMAYLIEKRFNFEWFPEGTRSRTGKLLPPKLGLLSYAADAYRQGKVEDLMLVPIAIIYDQSKDVRDYAREARGAEKKAENLGWMLKGLREQGEVQGKVYLRFGEPQSMRAALGPPDPQSDGNTPEERLALQKLALAVAWQTNRVTPITGIALVTFALLAAGERAVTLDRIMSYTDLLCRHARERGQPLTASAELDSPDKVLEVVAELIRTGVAVCYDKGESTVYAIAEGQHLAAAYYRNSMLHFVLERAIAELAVIAATEKPIGQREKSFWEWARALRDGLKFEFFFRERPLFERELEDELMRINPRWRELLEQEGTPVDIHRSIFDLGIAHAVLRPFIETHHVAADALALEPIDRKFDEAEFIDKCQRLGRQYLLQKELKNPESVSKPLFQSAIQLLRNMKLIDAGPDLAQRRASFARKVARSLKQVDSVEQSASHAIARYRLPVQ
ncbi:MAG: glycerol-3-phosphate 1-O-acyltransferase [Novosphingobium sp.]